MQVNTLHGTKISLHKSVIFYIMHIVLICPNCSNGVEIMIVEKHEKLTFKQRKFVIEYMKDLNATQAAIRAGYSKKTARIIASENLTKPHTLGTQKT